MQCEESYRDIYKVFKPKPRLLIVGGGHVGLNVYNVSKSLEFYTIVVDDREEFGNKKDLN